MIPRGVSYEEAMRQFRWPKPKKLNIGRAVCERHNPATGQDGVELSGADDDPGEDRAPP